MVDADKPRFLAVLNGLAAVKPGAKLTPEALDVWWTSMRNWPIDEFRAAAAQLAKSCEFFPSPYHFEQLRKAGEPTSGEVWAEVLELVRSGDYRQREHANPRVNAAVRAIGGWQAIANSNTEFTHLVEKRFAEHFEAIGDREDVREALPNLTGGPRLSGPVRMLLGRLAGKR